MVVSGERKVDASPRKMLKVIVFVCWVGIFYTHIIVIYISTPFRKRQRERERERE